MRVRGWRGNNDEVISAQTDNSRRSTFLINIFTGGIRKTETSCRTTDTNKERMKT